MPIPFTMINLDRPRKLRFGMGAMVEFEQITGIKLTSLDDELSFDVLAKILWVMLKQEEKELTFEQTLNLVDDHVDDLSEVMEAVTRAIQAAFNTGKKSPNVKSPTVK